MVDVFNYFFQTKKTSQELNAAVLEASMCCDNLDFDNCSKKTEHALSLCEKELIELREIYYSFYKQNSEQVKNYERNAAESLQIKIEQVDTSFLLYRITLPFLLPNQRSEWKNFKETIGRTLFYAINQFGETNELHCIENSVVTIVSYFNEKDNIYLCDNDNKEAKDILNVLSKRLISDDNGLKCSLFYSSKLTEQNTRTEIYICGKNDFVNMYNLVID